MKISLMTGLGNFIIYQPLGLAEYSLLKFFVCTEGQGLTPSERGSAYGT